MPNRSCETVTEGCSSGWLGSGHRQRRLLTSRRRRTATSDIHMARHKSTRDSSTHSCDRHRADHRELDRYREDQLTGLIPAEVEGLVSSSRGRKPTRAVVRGRRIFRPSYPSSLGSQVADLIRLEPTSGARTPRSRSRSASDHNPDAASASHVSGSFLSTWSIAGRQA